MELREIEGHGDTERMQRFARRLWPCGLHPGGLGWAAAIGQLAQRVAVVEDGEIFGWAGVNPGELVLHVDPAHPETAAMLVEWSTSIADAGDILLDVMEGDSVVLDAVVSAGLRPAPDSEPVIGMFRPADADLPKLQPGYRVRAVADGEWGPRVEAHRRSWRPVDLPWAPESRPEIDPEATSSFTAAKYEEVRRTWLYDLDLDLVVEAPDGELVGCCIVWWDPELGCAEIEPLGVAAEHRRRGLASALCHEASERIAERRGHTLFINVGPRADYPAPAATYLSAGFEAVERGRRYLLRVSS
jgi:ribosomal protein S18 acetylase RimI-like enzyme